MGAPVELNKSHNLINCSDFLTHESREFPLSPENFLSWIGSPDGWLEMEFAPSTYSEEQLDEFDRLTEEWIYAHERAAETA
jgi:hypothetical protein